MKLMRIPFDSLSLAAITTELSDMVGGKCQRVLQLDEFTVVIAIYAGGSEKYLLLSCDPEWARAHLIPDRPRGVPAAGTFGQLLRTSLDGVRLIGIKQIGFDRILHLEFSGSESAFSLICELMGKHSNLILVGPGRRIVTCARTVGTSKSVRPIVTGRSYTPPPLEKRRSLFNASDLGELKGSEGASPFLLKLIQANCDDDWDKTKEFLRQLKERVQKGQFEPVVVADVGAYPISVAALGLPDRPFPSLSAALFTTGTQVIELQRLTQSRTALLTQLSRVVLAREAARHDLMEAQDTARRAAELQERGDLILAYQHQVSPGDSSLRVFGFDGEEVEIQLLTDLTALENAERWFKKAKKAKLGASHVKDQIHRISEDKASLDDLIRRVESAGTVAEIESLKEEAQKKRWLHEQRQIVSQDGKSADPFQGHRIRSLLGPGGVSILYGENATSNDFLTLRIAKPNDWWLHVRGDVSAHVVIQTHNQPTKIGPEILRFAAEVAVRNSPQKHAGYVPVDYTLRKYVRKPKGAPVGTALYTHEKTIHIDLARGAR